MTKHKMEMRI